MQLKQKIFENLTAQSEEGVNALSATRSADAELSSQARTLEALLTPPASRQTSGPSLQILVVGVYRRRIYRHRMPYTFM
jgi:hypothetical protein